MGYGRIGIQRDQCSPPPRHFPSQDRRRRSSCAFDTREQGKIPAHALDDPGFWSSHEARRDATGYKTGEARRCMPSWLIILTWEFIDLVPWCPLGCWWRIPEARARRYFAVLDGSTSNSSLSRQAVKFDVCFNRERSKTSSTSISISSHAHGSAVQTHGEPHNHTTRSKNCPSQRRSSSE